MNVSIIFHSVTGNTYLLAKAFCENFSVQGAQVSLYRVADEDWVMQKDVPKSVHGLLEEMMKLTVATPEVMLKSELVLLGSPTYYGNVSAEMKAFMDATAVYWFDAKLAGKKLAAFTSAGHPQGGGDLCLQAVHHYGHHMGMISVSVPVTLSDTRSLPAYGLIHYSSAQYAKSLDKDLLVAVEKYSGWLLKPGG